MVLKEVSQNSQSIVSLPTPEYPLTLSSSDYTSCYEAEGSVYIRITDENGVRLNENTWNGASLEHDLDYGFPNESMSSFEISPGTYNYYVEALSYGECVSNPPYWAILLGEDTIVSGEAIYGLEGSFVVEESEIYGCTYVNALKIMRKQLLMMVLVWRLLTVVWIQLHLISIHKLIHLLVLLRLIILILPM